MKRMTLMLGLLIGMGWLMAWFLHQLPQQTLAQTAVTAQTHSEVTGDIAIITDTTWTMAGSPYLITNVVAIKPGIVLTIEAGVTVLAINSDYPLLDVEEGAYLRVQGTAESPVTFAAQGGSSPGAWAGLIVGGSAHIDYALFQHSLFNLDLYGETDAPVLVTNTVFSQSVHALSVHVATLHRLHLMDVTFVDLVNDLILIEVTDYDQMLTGNATLTAHPGLAGYEWLSVPILGVPTGITLTLEPGVTLMSPPDGIIALNGGHLQAIGTSTSPVTFTSASGIAGDWDGIVVGDTGSAYLEEVTIEKGVYNLGIVGDSTGPVVLQQSRSVRSTHFPLLVDVAALHRLHMETVHFYDNGLNRVMLDTFSASPLSASAHLTAQPGLEGYELWHGSAQPYDLIIPTGLTLTAAAGVTLFFPPDDGLQVQGHLQASGTLTHPVTFTAVMTSTPGWNGLHIQGSANLSHTLVTQAQNGVLVAGGRVTAVCSRFSHNLTTGIGVTEGGVPQLTITASNFYGNGQTGLLNETSTPVEARHNWWGDASGPGGLGPGNGDAVWGEVLYDPWLTETAVCPLPDKPIDEAISDLVANNSSPTPLNHLTYFTATISAGSNVSYTWNFGDGSVPATSYGTTANHIYSAVGIYTATVTASNSQGSEQATTMVTVTGTAPQPELLLDLTAVPQSVRPGETITYTLILTNSGNVLLQNLSSTVAVGDGFVLPASLAAAVSISASYTYTVRPGDLPDPLINQVMVTAEPPDHELLTVTTSVAIKLQQNKFFLYLPLVRN